MSARIVVINWTAVTDLSPKRHGIYTGWIPQLSIRHVPPSIHPESPFEPLQVISHWAQLPPGVGKQNRPVKLRPIHFGTRHQSYRPFSHPFSMNARHLALFTVLPLLTSATNHTAFTKRQTGQVYTGSASYHTWGGALTACGQPG